MKGKLYLLFTVMIIFVAFSCDNDEETAEPNKPYVGQWNSNIYSTLSLSGKPIKEQMRFTMTNNTFENRIYQSDTITSEDVMHVMAIKGSIDNSGDDTLSTEINSIAIGADGTPFINKNDSKEIEELFDQQFGGTLGKMLFEEFDATYNLYANGDSMLFTIPIKNDGDTINMPLKLGKIE